MIVGNYIKNLLAPSENIWSGVASLRTGNRAPGMVQMTLAIEDNIYPERPRRAIACARMQFEEYDVPTRRTLRT
jgi:hypothetical protein